MNDSLHIRTKERHDHRVNVGRVRCLAPQSFRRCLHDQDDGDRYKQEPCQGSSPTRTPRSLLPTIPGLAPSRPPTRWLREPALGGLPQHLDAAARVMINNRPCRIVGPVNMDQIVVESGSWAASLGTEATLIGVNPRAHSAGLGPLGEHIGT
ncbi:hypothetical protein FQP90_21180 [Paenarthrobacter nitroguajacolicus]|uniref:Alanine racemase C-terminal domain-containing protein n=1 Tax=Paenarthrobacter nitroguajacolicus TaxID=211146 RepID=A0A558GNK3_PAENT|nr:hypothetical protein FQP90_21180 [Paenarthrobacter nitroguajacolicus]